MMATASSAGSSSQLLQHGVSSSQHLQHGGSSSQRLQCGGAASPLGSASRRISWEAGQHQQEGRQGSGCSSRRISWEAEGGTAWQQQQQQEVELGSMRQMSWEAAELGADGWQSPGQGLRSRSTASMLRR